MIRFHDFDPDEPKKVTTLIPSSRRQATLSRMVSVTGFGYWSGQDVTIEFHPAPEDSGIVFVRTDLPGNPRIPALIQNRVPGPRRTTLVQNGCAVEMVEHVMAALAGLKIDNCEVHVNRAEMPGMDGSCLDFVNTLRQAHRLEQNSLRSRCRVMAPVRVAEGDAWIEARPVDSSTELKMTYQLDYPHAPSIGSQCYSVDPDVDIFIGQIAPARTFLLEQEADQLRQRGLGKRVAFSDLLVFGEDGPIQNELRFSDECARHKTLDMIGDFALAGKDFIGEFTACRSGHRLNSQMVFAVIQQLVNQPILKKSA